MLEASAELALGRSIRIQVYCSHFPPAIFGTLIRSSASGIALHSPHQFTLATRGLMNTLSMSFSTSSGRILKPTTTGCGGYRRHFPSAPSGYPGQKNLQVLHVMGMLSISPLLNLDTVALSWCSSVCPVVGSLCRRGSNSDPAGIR